MIEVKYDIETRLIRGWCADEARLGGLKPKEGQAVVMLDIDIPEKSPFAYLIKNDLTGLEANPDYVEPEPLLVFEPPETGIPEKVEYIEQFLIEIYKGGN